CPFWISDCRLKRFASSCSGAPRFIPESCYVTADEAVVCFHAPLYAFRQSLEGKTPDREIEGFWEGTLIIDNSQLIQVLTLSNGDSGMYSGKLEILHKGTYTIDAVTEAEGTICLQISQMQAVYEGTLDKGRSK